MIFLSKLYLISVQLQTFRENLVKMLRVLRNYKNFNKVRCERTLTSGSVFGDFQFKGKEKSALKSSYDVVIVGAGCFL